MNLSSTSWLHPSDDSYVVEDIRYPPEGRRRVPLRNSQVTSGTLKDPSRQSSHARESVALTSFHTTSTYEARLVGAAHLVRGRSTADVLADLQRIRGEANACVVRRILYRWGLHALRHGVLRRLQHHTRQLLWQRLGGRCFAWWRLVTERRLCREALYAEAAEREASLLRDVVCRGVWVRWRQWARARSRRRDRATRLSLVNRQRHAVLRFNVWLHLPHVCRLLRHLQHIRFTAERRLARFALVTWRLHALEGILLSPLQAHATQQVARWAFTVWLRGTLLLSRLRRVQRRASCDLGLRVLRRWKMWLRRRLQAALLLKANEARHLLHRFSAWAWRHQLASLDYQRSLR